MLEELVRDATLTVLDDGKGRCVDVGWLVMLAIRRMGLLIFSVSAASLAAFLVASNIPETYESRTTLLVGQPFTSNHDTLLADQLEAQTYAVLATTSPVLDKVIDEVGLDEASVSLASRVLAAAPGASNLVNIRVTDSNADRAADIANSVAAQLIAMTAQSTETSKNVAVIDPAVASTAPSWPRVAPMTAAGGALGLLLALIVIVGIALAKGDRQSDRP